MAFSFLTGVDLTLMLQRIAWLELPMRFFTFLGTAQFFMFVLPAVYWCIDAGLGMRIAFILLFSDCFNTILKFSFHGTRPYWISAQVKALASEISFGFPSNHSQLAAAIWGMAAARSRRVGAWLLAIALIFLIGLSRIYLGVHFPLDVLTGWLVGALTLWIFLASWEPVAVWIKQRPLAQQVLLSLALPALLLFISGMIVLASQGYSLPAEWLANAARAGGDPLAPFSMEGMLTSTGVMCGLAFGLIWIQRSGGYQPSGPVWKRILCFLVGLAGVALLYFGLKLVFPSGETLVAAGFRFARYALIGLWISAGAPFVFASLHLVEPGPAFWQRARSAA